MTGVDTPAGQVRLPLLGFDVTPMTAKHVVAWIGRARGKSLLLNHNLHSAYLYVTEDSFRSVYELADRTIIDGFPILTLARRRSPVRLSTDYRISSPDWIRELHLLPEPITIGVLGATQEANQAAVDALVDQLGHLGFTIEGLNGYEPRTAMVSWLHDLAPDLVIIGLGMPLQEGFLLEHWEDLPSATYATVGGAIDYVGGSNKLAPAWVGNIGMEWLWRLAIEPRRLAHRYLVEPFLLLGALIRQRRNRT